jgi:hypothetical protein
MVRASVLFIAVITTIAPVAIVSPAHAQSAVTQDSTSFKSLFTDLGNDVRNLPSIDNAVIIGIGGGLSFAVHSEDRDITREFTESPAVEEVLEPGEVFGGGFVQFGAALGVYILGRGSHNQRLSIVGADLVRSQILNAGMTQGIKLAVGRTRPDGSRYSFPSGHTSSSFATATVLQRHFGWRAGIPAYGLAAFVGGSRLQQNRHYLSDVIFGSAIGIVAGRATTVGHGRTSFAVSPYALDGGGGVTFTLVPKQ